MPLLAGVAGARRTAILACGAVILVAVIGAVAYASGSVGTDCGSSWAAVRKPFPSPLVPPAEAAANAKAKRNPYEAATEKARPIQECRRAGERRLVTAGVGSLILVLPALGVFIFAFLYWPGHEESTRSSDQTWQTRT